MLKRCRFWFLFIALAGFAIWLALPSLNYPWYSDDYHLIRVYRLPELWQAFTGHWDVDKMETASYRPLTTVLNHARALVFGENVLVHRLFGISMLAAFVSSVCFLMSELGLGLLYSLAAGFLVIASTSNSANLIWISDTVHAVSGLPVIAAALIACGPVFAWRQRLITVALGFASLLVREDAAAMFPFVVFVAFFAENCRFLPSTHQLAPNRHTGSGLVIGRALAVIISLGIALVTYFALRYLFVPNAPLNVLHIGGLIDHIIWALLPAGMPPLLPEPIFEATLLISGTIVVLAFALGSNELGRALAASLALAAVISCTPGLVIERVNLLLFPTTIFAVFFALCTQIIVRSFSQVSVSIAAGIAAFTIWLGVIASAFHQSRIAQEALHPFSLAMVSTTNDMVYGDSHQRGARLPEARLAFGMNYLARFGIDSADSFTAKFNLLEVQANTERRFRPYDEKVFAPVSGRLIFSPENYRHVALRLWLARAASFVGLNPSLL